MGRQFLLFLCLLFICGHSQTTVYQKGEAGYFCFKIPDLLVLSSGSILAFAEARKNSCNDSAWTDLVVKSSQDAGQTWSEMQIVFSNASSTERTQIGNAVPVQLKSGRILVPFCRNNTDVFLTISDDDGKTWTSPRQLESVVHPEWLWVGLGPPGAIVLSSGRILVPGYHTFWIRFNGQFTYGHVMYSDDDGATWQLGATDIGSSENHMSNECQAVERPDGSILINFRGLLTRRIQAISFDGGLTFGPSRLVPELKEPIDGCEGSLIGYPSHNLTLYSGPNSQDYRVNMTLWASADGGDSWKVLTQVDPGNAGYSSLQVMGASRVVILYEVSDERARVMTPDRLVFRVVWN